ncbi:MAG: ribulose-phosphate 3-epimerase [Eubacteriales bacterium]|nr:ribulose-phosphate 3-epimerase [Eubacteriales bacterium]
MIKIAPSILAADFADMGAAVKKIEKAGADLVHCDVMDGNFVPNITFGPDMIKALKRYTALPLDVHLMIDDPAFYIPIFAKAGADILTFHYELHYKHKPAEMIRLIKENGVKAAIAINPDTEPEGLTEFLPMLDMVLVMSVYPGFGGQSFIPSSLDKIAKIRRKAQELGLDIDIEVDGGINAQNVVDVKKAGANVIVAGTTVFKAPDTAAIIAELKK